MLRPNIDDPLWRSLLARGAILHASATQLCQFAELLEAGRDSADALRIEMGRACALARCSHSDVAAVEEAAASWRERLEQTRQAGILDDEGDLFDGLLESAARLSAKNPFRILFDTLSAQAAAAYDDAWPSDVVLILDWCREPPRMPVDRYPVTAFTDIGSRGVTVQVWPDGLGPHVWSVLPRLMCHELICHVGAARATRVDPRSIFAEGFMDWVSRYFLHVWSAPLLAELGVAARVHARRSFDVFAPPGTPEGRTRRLGEVWAEQLVDKARAGGGLDDAAARTRIARLGVAMNRLDRSVAEKDRYLRHLVLRGSVEEVAAAASSPDLALKTLI